MRYTLVIHVTIVSCSPGSYIGLNVVLQTCAVKQLINEQLMFHLCCQTPGEKQRACSFLGPMEGRGPMVAVCLTQLVMQPCFYPQSLVPQDHLLKLCTSLFTTVTLVRLSVSGPTETKQPQQVENNSKYIDIKVVCKYKRYTQWTEPTHRHHAKLILSLNRS